MSGASRWFTALRYSSSISAVALCATCSKHFNAWKPYSGFRNSTTNGVKSMPREIVGLNPHDIWTAQHLAIAVVFGELDYRNGLRTSPTVGRGR